MTNSFFIFHFFFFLFELTTQGRSAGKYHMTNVTHHMLESHRVMSHDKSHDKYGKIVHKLYSSCISSIQEIEEDSIKFSLLTRTWSRFKSSWLESYKYNFSSFYLVTTRQL